MAVQEPTAYTVEGQVADARASVGDITAEAQFCVSEIGVLRREDLEIALASEVLRLREALTACVTAHETGRYEPAQIAYEAAKIVLGRVPADA